jgi:hypothetical protein
MIVEEGALITTGKTTEEGTVFGRALEKGKAPVAIGK